MIKDYRIESQEHILSMIFNVCLTWIDSTQKRFKYLLLYFTLYLCQVGIPGFFVMDVEVGLSNPKLCVTFEQNRTIFVT